MATRLPSPGPANIPPAISSEIEGAPGAAPSSRPNPAAAAELGDALRAEIAAELRAEREAEGFGRAKGHNFWTRSLNIYDPKAQFRFSVQIPGLGLEDNRERDAEGIPRNLRGGGAANDAYADRPHSDGNMIWWVKTADKPGYSLTNRTEGQEAIDGVPDSPQISKTPKFKPVTMTFIDPVYPNVSRKISRLLRRAGFQDETAAKAASAVYGGGSEALKGTIEFVKINQLDAQGRIIETWTLYDVFPAEVDYGKLDYSSDDLVEITVTWGYRTFSVHYPDIGNEIEFEYFKDIDQTGFDLAPNNNNDDDLDDLYG